MKKRFAITVLALALTAGSAMTSFAAGFTGTGKGVKYQWGDGAYCTNNWVQYKNHWFYFGDDQLMRTGWIQKDGTWYYAADTGELQGGIMKINGNVYYFDTSTCKMVTGNYSYNGGTHEFTENVISYYFGDELFSEVFGKSEGNPVKPSPAIVDNIMDKLNISKENTVMIGDTCIDIKTGKNAGIKTIGCLWGFRTLEELVNAGADYIADKPLDIVKYLCE